MSSRRHKGVAASACFGVNTGISCRKFCRQQSTLLFGTSSYMRLKRQKTKIETFCVLHRGSG